MYSINSTQAAPSIGAESLTGRAASLIAAAERFEAIERDTEGLTPASYYLGPDLLIGRRKSDGRAVVIDESWIYIPEVKFVYLFKRSVDSGPEVHAMVPSRGDNLSPQAEECAKHAPGDSWTRPYRLFDDDPIEMHHDTLIGEFEVVEVLPGERRTAVLVEVTG